MRGLYAIIDPEHCRHSEPVAVASAILEAGCAALQLRAKRLEGPALRDLGGILSLRCRALAIPFFVNDDPHLAVELQAAGVHLGQDDMRLEQAREIMGRRLIGVSTHSLEQALEAERRGADMIGFGPVFPTSTKRHADPVVGIDALQTVCERVRIPVIAIGGIDENNVGRVAASGASMAAAISALCAAPDPSPTARVLHQAFPSQPRSA